MFGVAGNLLAGSPFSVKVLRNNPAGDGGGGKRPSYQPVGAAVKCLWSGSGSGSEFKFGQARSSDAPFYFVVAATVDVKAGDRLELQAYPLLAIPQTVYEIVGEPSRTPVGLIEIPAKLFTR